MGLPSDPGSTCLSALFSKNYNCVSLFPAGRAKKEKVPTASVGAEGAMSEARTDCARSEGHEVRAVCEWSEGGANGSLRHESGLRLLLAARCWRPFCFQAGLACRGKKDDRAAARCDQQASQTRQPVDALRLSGVSEARTNVEKRQKQTKEAATRKRRERKGHDRPQARRA